MQGKGRCAVSLGPLYCFERVALKEDLTFVCKMNCNFGSYIETVRGHAVANLRVGSESVPARKIEN